MATQWPIAEGETMTDHQADLSGDLADVPPVASFEEQYRPQLKDVMLTLAREAVADGSDADAQAREYTARGKPDFVLAYLLLGTLPDEQRRELYAHAHEQRAIFTEQRAREFDSQFHRPFPLLRTEAAKDRMVARQVRAGRSLPTSAEKHLPPQP